MNDNENDKDQEEMHRREITLQDGRYMIFYTFGDDELEREVSEQREDV
jgi:ssDNA-binding replication factor A large subunit